jgi:hypothetical protein
MQTQWPALGPTFDFSSLDGTATAGEAGPLWAGRLALGTAAPLAASDGVGRPWWSCGTAGANPTDPLAGLFSGSGGSNGTLFGLVSGLVNVLGQLVGALLNAGTNPNRAGTPYPLPRGQQQQFQSVDVSSTGDPHIAEVGTRAGPGGASPVDVRWDSMTGHDDLVHSNQIEGGYRVATTVTQPDANGITSNQSATVHTNFEQDAITLNRNGAFQIFDDGEEVRLGRGESATLSGGERVDVNQDGSLTVSSQSANGGTIATTLRSTGAGVDVTTHAQNLALGGDAVTHGATAAGTPVPHHHRAHRPRHTPVAHIPTPMPSVGMGEVP